jgi:hypothetical protein
VPILVRGATTPVISVTILSRAPFGASFGLQSGKIK